MAGCPRHDGPAASEHLLAWYSEFTSAIGLGNAPAQDTSRDTAKEFHCPARRCREPAWLCCHLESWIKSQLVRAFCPPCRRCVQSGV